MLPRTSLSHLQSYLLLARFILFFYVSCGCWRTCRRSSTSISLGGERKVYYKTTTNKGKKMIMIVGDEDDIGNEHFKWSRASTFSYSRNAIGLAVAYASAIRTHLSVHGTAHPMSAASFRPRSAADCLIRSAVTSLFLVGRETLLQARLLSVALSAATFPMALVRVQSGGVAILRWFLACLQASFPVLLTLLLPLRRRAVVTTSLRKVKHHIAALFESLCSLSLLWL